jgi:hypothetical protein
MYRTVCQFLIFPLEKKSSFKLASFCLAADPYDFFFSLCVTPSDRKKYQFSAPSFPEPVREDLGFN